MAVLPTRLAIENWMSKYQYDGESDLGTFVRVARAIAEVDRTYGADDTEVQKLTEDYLQALVHFDPNAAEDQYQGRPEQVYVDKFGAPVGLYATPGGRITANLGTDYEKATAWNCFINSPVTGATITYQKRVPNSDQIIDCEISSEQTPDNLTNIFLSLLEAAETLKSEGGYGINFGFIRPRGTLIKGVGIRHPGVVSYMELWDKMSSMIVKGDNDGYHDTLVNHLADSTKNKLEKVQPRKGAMMAVLPIWHPDVEEFIRAKQESGRLTKFNISVLIDDAFMQAVQDDTFYDLHFNGEVYKKVMARDLYDLIMTSTYNRNEPGCLFFDNMNKCNPLIYLGPCTASNPCGEIGGTSFMDQHYQPAEYLAPYMKDLDDHMIGFTTVCLLASLNLPQFVNAEREFDYDKYAEVVALVARMLENVNDTGVVPLPAYEWAVQNIRQYGMGINGLGSVLYMMGIRYGSPEALEFVGKIHQIKDDVSLRVSALLAKDRGPFPMYDERYLDTPYFQDICTASEETKALVRKYGVRNAKRLTNPPLGNSSVICGSVSNGIEPVFSWFYDRVIIADEWPEGLTRDNVKDLFEEVKMGDSTVWRGEFAGRRWHYEPHNRGLCFIDEVRDFGYDWVMEHFPEDFENEEPYLTTAQELQVIEHVKMQAKVQESCDQSVSKTCNIPNDYPFDDFKDLYFEAWKAGLVGFTTYRDGTMEAVLETTGPKVGNMGSLLESLIEQGCTPEDAEITAEGVVVRDVRLPAQFINGPTTTLRREGNKYYLHLSYLSNDPVNPVALWIHSNSQKEGEFVTLNRAFKAVVALLRRGGVANDLVDSQVAKIHIEAHHVRLGKIISMALRHNVSVPRIVAAISDIEGDYIATTLTAVRKYLMDQIQDGAKAIGMSCPVCSSTDIVFESGCSACRSCGNSGCG